MRAMRCRGGGKLTLETRNVVLDETYAERAQRRDAGHLCADCRQRYRRAASRRICSTRSSSRSSRPRRSARAPGSASAWSMASSSSRTATSRSTARKATARRSRCTCRARWPARDAAPAREPERLEGGHEVVLVVEDDPLVRNYVVAQIQSLGYTTLSASNAAEAMAVLDNVAAASTCCSPTSSCPAR